MREYMGYSRLKMDNDLYVIIGPDGERIKTHQETAFPLLSENLSENLISDLNDIRTLNESALDPEFDPDEDQAK